MRFSAQGYARLNERLNPDIAVLEGGYSIEGALPYVNVGIILAMAGLDYSHVREPDYHPESIRQSDEITRYIRETTKDVLDLWKKRDSFKAEIVKGAKYARRKRNIYYDTDGIREQQEETVRICDDCGGFIAIDSMASTGKRVYAVIIPSRSCDLCRLEGEKHFRSIDKVKLGARYLVFQDRDRDVYIMK
jgi:hypothetical protein